MDPSSILARTSLHTRKIPLAHGAGPSENAKKENVKQSNNTEGELRDWKMGHKTEGLENVGKEI